ncbi:cytochrome P450 [Actinomadura madurae]|uniref:cytochrome P450 n=1 Tax=Actinomadura madurae TaxID=1993 RepID=UPI0020D205FC|nr:cytochrome P450 [Actinomadura madurae]MCP9964422.1 cytochrome P450 [Actinomadura madurae]
MAPDTPVRASSPHRVRGAARGPSPSPSLTVRHGIGFAMNPCASLLRLYAEAGPVAAIGTRRKPFVHLFGPDANAFVFANSALFQWREAFDLLVPVNGETALIVSDGADHRRRRRLVQPAFHHRRVAGYVARMAANTDAALDSWRPGQTLDAYAELRAVIRRNTVEVLFGDRLAADAEVIGPAAAGRARRHRPELRPADDAAVGAEPVHAARRRVPRPGRPPGRRGGRAAGGRGRRARRRARHAAGGPRRGRDGPDPPGAPGPGHQPHLRRATTPPARRWRGRCTRCWRIRRRPSGRGGRSPRWSATAPWRPPTCPRSPTWTAW